MFGKIDAPSNNDVDDGKARAGEKKNKTKEALILALKGVKLRRHYAANSGRRTEEGELLSRESHSPEASKIGSNHAVLLTTRMLRKKSNK